MQAASSRAALRRFSRGGHSEEIGVGVYRARERRQAACEGLHAVVVQVQEVAHHRHHLGVVAGQASLPLLRSQADDLAQERESRLPETCAAGLASHRAVGVVFHRVTMVSVEVSPAAPEVGCSVRRAHPGAPRQERDRLLLAHRYGEEIAIEVVRRRELKGFYD